MSGYHPTIPQARQPGDGDVPLPAHSANYTPLSPLSFIARSAEVYPDQLSVIHGDLKYTWSESYQRCQSGAARLAALGISTGDVVAVIAPNIPELFELHYAVPMVGATLNAINTRLEAETVAYILNHGAATVLFVDRESTATVKAALKELKKHPKLVDINDAHAIGDAIS